MFSISYRNWLFLCLRCEPLQVGVLCAQFMAQYQAFSRLPVNAAQMNGIEVMWPLDLGDIYNPSSKECDKV